MTITAPAAPAPPQRLASRLLDLLLRPRGLAHAGAGAVSCPVEHFVTDAVHAAVRRGELMPETDTAAVADALMGLLWGAAFQMSRSLHPDGPRTERLLGQLHWLLQPG